MVETKTEKEIIEALKLPALFKCKEGGEIVLFIGLKSGTCLVASKCCGAAESIGNYSENWTNCDNSDGGKWERIEKGKGVRVFNKD